MDPFLQTSELQHMKEWFQTLPNPTYTRLDFIEPNLSFEIIAEKRRDISNYSSFIYRTKSFMV